MINWLFVLWFAAGMFAAGYCLACILVLFPQAAKDERSIALPIPDNDADAVVIALNVVGQTHEKLYLAFEAMSHEDRSALKGLRSHTCAIGFGRHMNK